MICVFHSGQWAYRELSNFQHINSLPMVVNLQGIQYGSSLASVGLKMGRIVNRHIRQPNSGVLRHNRTTTS